MKRLYFLVLLFYSYSFAQPSWYHNIPYKSYEIVAFGADKELEVARDIAKVELSKQINLNISSKIDIDKSISHGNYNKSIKKNISSSSTSTLSGVKILKEIQKDNLWYVAVSYDTRSLLQKIQSDFPSFKKSDIKDIKNLNIIRDDKSWYFLVSQKRYLLSQKDFVNIFANIDNQNITLTTNKMIYSYPEMMRFFIQTKHKGYISLLYSEESGKVGVILENAPIDKTLTYPKKDAPNQLIAYNPSKKTITELYVAIYSKQKLDLREFETISENLLDESNYNFDKLLDIIKTKEFTTIKLKIRGN
ncbi:MAG: LPP20 family lipoprotein [Campylobacterota bacterium]|nr:LPP20 family lipoprotein [Campylobacterota bacterium]